MSILDIFRPRKHEEELAVLLNVGSSSVRGALVLLRREKPPKILYVTRHEMRVHQHIDFEKFISSMKKALVAVLSELEKDGLPHLTFTHRGSMAPRKVSCIFEAPWHASHVQVFSVEKQAPFRVDHTFLSDTLDKETATFKDVQSRRYFEEGVKKGDVRLIEKKLLRVELNGYEVKDPYNKKAKNVTMHLFMSVVPAEVQDLIENKIKRAFHLESDAIMMHSFTLASFSVFRDIWSDARDFLIVQVGGEVTEVSLVRHETLVEAVSFPVGKNFLVRKISRNLKVTHEEALSLLNVYAAEKGSEEMSERVAGILNETREIWVKAFRNAIVNVGSGLLLPSRVFLVVEETLVEWFEKLIEESEFEKEDLTESAFTVQRVGQTTLSHFLEASASIQHDPFISTNALFVNKM